LTPFRTLFLDGWAEKVLHMHIRWMGLLVTLVLLAAVPAFACPAQYSGSVQTAG
jgi:hypothetical protein